MGRFAGPATRDTDSCLQPLYGGGGRQIQALLHASVMPAVGPRGFNGGQFMPHYGPWRIQEETC
jgi:hypothetical protein